jgi:hypothetical protein
MRKAKGGITRCRPKSRGDSISQDVGGSGECLGKVGVDSKIRIRRIISGTNTGASNELTSVVGKNAKGHSVTHVVLNTHKIPQVFSRFRRKRVVINAIQDPLKEVKQQEGADVRCATVQELHGNALEAKIVGVVENVTHVQETLKPEVSGGTSAIENRVGDALDVLYASFSTILMLIMWFTLPLGNEQHTANLLDLGASLGFGTVTDELGGRPMESDDIHQRLGEIRFGAKRKHIGDQCVDTHKKLDFRDTTAVCTNVGKEGIRGNGFFAASNIERWIGRFVMLLEDGTLRESRELCGILEGLLDNIGGLVGKQRPELLKIGIVSNEQRRWDINEGTVVVVDLKGVPIVSMDCNGIERRFQGSNRRRNKDDIGHVRKRIGYEANIL